MTDSGYNHGKARRYFRQGLADNPLHSVREDIREQ